MIIDLPVPKAQHDLDLHRVGSWEGGDGANNHPSRPPESSLCPFAVAFGSFVFGVRQTGQEGEPWLSWKTSFAPYNVRRVTSNRDGSIIACTTDAGTVALMRGIDGSVLATRRVTSEAESSILPVAHASFIASDGNNQNNDALLIRIPSTKQQTDFLLVSNINSSRLNSKNPLHVAEAARKMAIHSSLKLNCGKNSIVSVCGGFLGDSRIRILALDSKENVFWQDYAGVDTPFTSTMEPVSWKPDNRVRSIDLTIGLRVHELNKDAKFVMFCAQHVEGVSVYFLDHAQLCVAGSFDVPNQSNKPYKKKNHTKVFAMEPISTVESGLAVAVACKPIGSNAEGGTIQIMQTCFNGQELESFHPVYTIPINENITFLSMASIQLYSSGPYSFLFRVWHGEDSSSCKAFLSEGDSVGRIRLLIQSGEFDRADHMINNLGENVLVSESYAEFSPSEVALGRLQHLLKRGSVSDKAAMMQAKQCFHRLSSGCISGNFKAGLNLAAAAESLAKWASPKSSPNPPGLMEVTTAISTVVKALGEVIKILPPDRHEMFERKKEQLEDQLLTIRYLAKAKPDRSIDRASFVRRFQGSRDPGQLFANLVADSCFSAAEGLWNSHLRPKIQPEVAVGAILEIRTESDPQAYLGLLEHLVLPSLTIDYELLPSICNWCCQLADDLDEVHNLEKAIGLLQSMERATNRLQLQMHRSFSAYSPFIERPAASRKSKVLLLRNNTSASNADTSFNSVSIATPQRRSVSTPATSTSKECAFPTVLELGKMSRGPLKSSHLTTKDISSKANACGEDSTKDVVQVRDKLIHATCLSAARRLGLDNRVTSLKSFEDFGGTQNVATELVRFLSASSRDHDCRSAVFQEKLKPFCETFAIDFDESLLEYVKSLCASKTATQESVQEAASVAQCCTSVPIKCQCVLVVLRAALLVKYSPTWLSDLSREAVEWSALDLGLRSELVEAARLLSIESIVRSYCGADSCDLFRVDNPRHGLRLLDYVTQQFRRESVLKDALDLADAFSHLNRLDACVALCSHAIYGSCIDLCSDILEKLYELDPGLADNTCIRVVSFCCELVNESSAYLSLNLPLSRLQTLKKRALNGSSAGCAIIPMIFARSQSLSTLTSVSTPRVDTNIPNLENLKLDFLRINEMQRNHSVFLSFSDLRNTTKLLKVAETLMVPVVDSYIAGDWKTWNIKLGRAKRACSLLAAASECRESEFWSATVSVVASPLKWSDGRCLEFLRDVGVLASLSSTSPVTARTVLSVAFGFCVKMATGARPDHQMTFNEDIGRSVALVQDYCLVSCPNELVLQSQSLLTLSEMVWRVLLRGDECVGENLETFRRGLLAQSWSQQFEPNQNHQSSLSPGTDGLHSRCRVPPLYTTWYIGDGLLLPPSESITRSLKFCKEMINTLSVSHRRRFVPLTSGGISEMSKFLSHRGALSVALRLLSCSSVLIMCSGMPNVAYSSIAKSIQDVVAASVERCLGGTGSGIISNIVDSQQAVSFLLSLNIKLAFQAFKNALPTALSTGDYSRVISLAGIGVRAASGQNDSWQKQVKFVSQCKQYVQRAVWWRFIKKNHIAFDHKKFDETTDSKASPYSRSLVVPLIVSLLSTMHTNVGNSPVKATLNILWRYADTFGFPRSIVVELYVRYLLSYPDETSASGDIRFNLCRVEEYVRELSFLLQPGTGRALLFRACVVALEKDERASKDYGRHALALGLYRNILMSLRETNSAAGKKLGQQILEAELESIERRRDALAILSSVFEKEKEHERPSFPSFFLPLPLDFSQYSRDVAVSSCGILGNDKKCDTNAFDPLEPLNGLLLRAYEVNVATALSPLCIPLGLPSGYINARVLMDQFRLALEENSSMPSYDHDVLPVFSRVQASADKAALAEWCSNYYSDDDGERLNVLELALNCAIKHSNEAEQRQLRSSRTNTDTSHAQEVMQALEQVQRLSKAKSSLSDKIVVVEALKKDHSLDSIASELLQTLEETLWKSSTDLPTSDRVVEVLLAEASSLAARKCVESVPLSMRQFQQFSLLVNTACQALASEHSHIHVGGIAWAMARSWLSQGGLGSKTMETDKSGGGEGTKNARLVIKSSPIGDVQEEEDTINFVMDLSAIQEDTQIWCDEIPAANAKPNDGQNITADEEQFALTKTEREESEIQTTRAALRVAFVLACQDLKDPDASTGDNTPRSPKTRQLTRSAGRHKPGSLLARIEQVGAKQNQYALDCARHLLQVVFAKPETRCESKLVTDSDRNLSKSVTFAMRHRALRSAAVLVPQEALEQVVDEEGYLAPAGDTTSLSLGMCAFGVFIASECETIGMPLAHSDLGNISAMHFSSYARTLWRHHRDGDLKGSRGRLLLLLLEMSLKDEDTIDAAFVELILTEMVRLDLQRTVLLACERIVALKDAIGFAKYEAMVAACGNALDIAVTTAARSITAELRREAPSLSKWDEKAANDAASTIYRCGQVVAHFSATVQGQSRLEEFLREVSDAKKAVIGNVGMEAALVDTINSVLRHVHVISA
ncbi:expressed unknown protein [Seminavis robusta]|uniref:KNTC1 third ARM-repeats domain-containing protein n=1 Tax=Seminavis robusta TaxID=568900 RepID=A0A9N8DJ73_9STRA|nr:expressed unknown protein [Seminavis robusta]|eukprot:Sro151_g069040.1 n/a (2516) ;mRNA; r:9811-17630